MRPPAEYARLVREEPISRVTLPSGELAWLAAGYEPARTVLSDLRFSKQASTRPGAITGLPITEGSESIFSSDPPAHTRLRRLIAGPFRPRNAEALRPRIERLTDDLLDEMERKGPPADLISHLAMPLPITVICELLGVPSEDAPHFRAWTDTMLSLDPSRRGEVRTAMARLWAYFGGLLEHRRRHPGDDLLTKLLRIRDEGDRLDDGELRTLGMTLLTGGYQILATHLGHGIIHLLRAPEVYHRVGHDPVLRAQVVTELLRYTQSGGSLGSLRIALEDVELDGTLIKAGEAVVPLINAANRDPRVFDLPDELRLSRDPGQHLAFGHGIHRCLGAHLARVQLETTIGALSRRLPALRLLVGEEELAWHRASTFHRPVKVPVSW
ncbi:cytochrome P450 [[Actinomadura] parvosata]|uniref:cytochrome P450 n=1 Tax=[Actinomadura] parvosata TaxID=1955412 RepID=UPI001E4AF2CB|nr:cytochrome P450 [Nonomuraea sp. ATCC 55076]